LLVEKTYRTEQLVLWNHKAGKETRNEATPIAKRDPLELSTNAFEPWSEVRDHNANTNNVKAEYDISTQVAESKEDVFLRKSREYREEIEKVKSCSARKRAAKDREATHTSPNQGATWVSIDAKMNLASEFIIPDYNSTPEDKGGTDFSCKYKNITDPHMRKGRPEDNHANFIQSQWLKTTKQTSLTITYRGNSRIWLFLSLF
jgi:hypothetical protein